MIRFAPRDLMMEIRVISYWYSTATSRATFSSLQIHQCFQAAATSGVRRQGDVAATRIFHVRHQVQLQRRQGGLKYHGPHRLFDPVHCDLLDPAQSSLPFPAADSPSSIRRQQFGVENSEAPTRKKRRRTCGHSVKKWPFRSRWLMTTYQTR
jgi:hypothetical protein